MNNNPDNCYLSNLFKKIQAGDRQAFNEFYKNYAVRLLNFAKQMLIDSAIAEEIVSDLFVQIWQKKETLIEIQKPEFYLYRSLKNLCLNEIRKKSYAGPKHSDEFEDCTGTKALDPLDVLIDKELCTLLTQAIQTLPMQRKLIFTLIREDGLKQKEVAELLDLSLRTVENQMYRAVKYLSGYVEAYLKKEQSIINKSKIKRFLFSLL